MSFKKSASKFVFQVINGNTTVGSGYFSQLDACSKLSINYSEIMPEGWYYENSAYGQKVEDAISKTGGVSLIYDFGPTTRDVYEHICKCAAPPQIKFNVLVPTGWENITLDDILDENNGVDTDKDGLTDWEEVDTDRLSWNSDGSVLLPTIEECMKFAEKPYAEQGLAKFREDHWVSGMPSSAFEQYIAYVVRSTYVLPIFTDPTSKDSDGDGFEDLVDISPLMAKCFIDFDHYKHFKYGDKTTFTIFVDQPYENSREVININDSDEFVGHTYVGVDSGKDYKEYAGFWPLNPYTAGEAVFKKTVYGCIKMQGKAFFTYGTNSEMEEPYIEGEDEYFESNHKWDIAYVCQTDNVKLGDLNDYASEYLAEYNMVTNNCTTFAVNLMLYFDLDAPIYPQRWQSSEKGGLSLLNVIIYMGYSPADAGEDIRVNCPLYIYWGREISEDGIEIVGIMEGRN